MKFANVDGTRYEAQPGMRGVCSTCGAVVIAKCGEMKVWHWAHLSVRDCDTWSEPETQWHRDWKSPFPRECQEVHHVGPEGEVHRADVKTKVNVVLEFQHSNISREERTSRENFYTPMIWVVDGRRLRRDLPTFMDALAWADIYDRSPLRLIMPSRGVPIVERWAKSSCSVYLDFGDADFSSIVPIKDPILWRLALSKRVGYFIATPVSRLSFIAHHTAGAKLLAFRLLPPPPPQIRPSPLPGFEAYSAVRERRRRRSFGG